METTTAATTAGHPYTKLKFVYDWQGRRIARTVWKGGTAGSPTFSSNRRWLYDGWNVIAEFSATTETTTTVTRLNTFTWGLDLSGSLQSLQGAGGVGGLLVQTAVSGGVIERASYDGNGNIVAWTKSTASAPTSRREYDAFGNTLVSEGTAPSSFGFSTKMQDVETGLYYYGYRFYDPATGRWPSRDPIGERGGINLYEFVSNNSISNFDRWGLLLTKSNGAATYHYSGKLGISTAAATVKPEFVINPKISLKGKAAKLEITGQLPGMIVLLNSNRTDLAIIRDDFGNNVGDHEKVHVHNWRDNWNAMRDNLSSLDGEYCPTVCASIAAKSAKIIRDIFYANAIVINASFDLKAYPVDVAETPGEEARLNKIVSDGENTIKQGQNKLKQLENEWTSNKCTKQ